ncbi:MAG: SPOR domain-containing protein [Bacteroidota bacterium]|nr:SPOR domain-containing protein [Bacteroidota bacterium]
MNLADYLSELLIQRNEVSIPGLGRFERIRINGYYNEQEAKFYPPGHKVKFVSEANDDDIFAEYVAGKKNISPASSKYFIEKFITKLREDASEGATPFADLGWFETAAGQLVFKPNDKVGNDPLFYGFAPVSVTKAGEVVSEDSPNNVFTEPEHIDIAIDPIAETTEEQQYAEGEAEGKKLLNIWLVLLIIITIVVLALLGTYQYNRVLFNRFNPFYQQPVIKKAVIVPVVTPKANVDTSKKAMATTDTSVTTNVATAPAATQELKTIDTLKEKGFAIRVDAFKREKIAIQTVNIYKSRGLDARIMPRSPRKLYKVIVGNYSTYNEAVTAKQELVRAKKIRKDSQVTSTNNKK